MIDFYKQTIQVKCKRGRIHNAMLEDVVNRRIIRCSCGLNTQLDDGNGSVKRGVSKLSKSLKQLEGNLRKFAR
jgi:hypothetical protein